MHVGSTKTYALPRMRRSCRTCWARLAITFSDGARQGRVAAIWGLDMTIDGMPLFPPGYE
jgi:hypothetical protein